MRTIEEARVRTEPRALLGPSKRADRELRKA